MRAQIDRSERPKRFRAVVVVCLGLLMGVPGGVAVSIAPAPASAQSIEQTMPVGIPHRGQCIRLTKQLLRYAGDLEMARDRGNALWEEATNQQIARLANRRDRLCPSIAANPNNDLFWRRVGNILGIAAQAAIKYFTWGAL